jgi:hypothetical protein
MFQIVQKSLPTRILLEILRIVCLIDWQREPVVCSREISLEDRLKRVTLHFCIARIVLLVRLVETRDVVDYPCKLHRTFLSVVVHLAVEKSLLLGEEKPTLKVAIPEALKRKLTSTLTPNFVHKQLVVGEILVVHMTLLRITTYRTCSTASPHNIDGIHSRKVARRCRLGR